MGTLKGRILCVLALAASTTLFDQTSVTAQPNETTLLPDINVTDTRLVGGAGRGRRGTAVGVATESGPVTETVDGAASSGIVTGTIITGASSTVITAEDIRRSPGHSLQDILAREPGIQVRNLFGQVNGASSTVDMRGFGAAAASNTLVLINGRRLNDIDLAGVDFSSIPRESIERIEITRGNSGAVLYGDGAVGGVINIVTKSGVALPPSARVQGGFGSFNYRDGSVSAQGSSGPFAASVHASGTWSDGYRENNKLRQNNAVGDFRWNNGAGTGAYLNLSADDNHLGLPGGRRVTLTSSELETDRRGAATPFDFAEKKGINATTGVTHVLWTGTELILDGGVRNKKQRAGFFTPFAESGFLADLTTVSVTPRLLSEHQLGNMPGKLITGIDVYHSIYGSDRSKSLGDPPIHRYDLQQTTAAGYFQETVRVRPDFDVAFGARIQRNSIRARDRLDPNAPGFSPLTCFPPFGCFGDTEGLPLDRSETQYAWHVGAEHRVTNQVAFFARAARSFRVPNVDERVGMAPSGTPTNFDLKTQTSHDVEAGIRTKTGPVEWQISAYLMDLNNELFFSPATFTNLNLDPTRRYGVENILVWRIYENLRLRGGLAYTRAIFREGPFAGNDVPLVSPWTGSLGVSWNIYHRYVVFDAVARFFSARRMDNDSANFQPLIPGTAVVDLRIGGEYDKFFWSVAVQNVFNALYFEYAVASTFTLGAYNAYPLPGRTFLARAGMTF
jgi:iron complex outermembrane receptor protein